MTVGDELEQGVVGGLGRWLIAGGDLNLSQSQARRYLEGLQLQARALGGAQGVRDLGLRNTKQAEDSSSVCGGAGDRRPKRVRLERHPPHGLKLARWPRQD